MLEDALLDITNRGELIVDPFLGSGSTLIAAQNTGRICFGIETDPLYVDLICRRYEAETRKNVVLDERGEIIKQIVDEGTRQETSHSI